MEKTKHKPEDYSQPMTTGEVIVNEIDHEDVFMIGNHEGKWKIAIAGKLVSRREFDSREEAREYIQSKPWELIFNATCIMYENIQAFKQQQNIK